MINTTVVICTYRRLKELKTSMKSLWQQVIGQSCFEVIVVDNAGDQDVCDFVSDLSQEMPNLRYIHESSLGLSYARNRGAEAAKGDWVVYLDDDAIPDENWLQNLLVCIQNVPKVGVIGGTVLPVWPQRLPKWLAKEFYPALSICEYEGDGTFFPLNFPTQYPVGANIAYPRELLQVLGGFKAKFGRQGQTLLSGEETDLNFRLQAAGYPIWYCPRAIVHHLISPDRLTRSFFRSRFSWSGRTWALLDAEIHDLNYVKRKMFTKLFRGMTINLVALIYQDAILAHNPFLFEVRLRELWGYIIQAMEIIRDGRN